MGKTGKTGRGANASIAYPRSPKRGRRLVHRGAERGRPAPSPGGVFAGALVSVSLLLASEGGIAKTDAMLAAMTGLSVLALVEVWLAETPAKRRKWAVLMWVFVALAALIKGPVTPIMMGLAVLALCALERRLVWLKVFFYWPGPVLAALIILPWLIGVQVVSEGRFLTEALGGDMAPKVTSGHEGHGAPPGSHLLLLPLLFLPAIVSLPAGIASLVKDWREQTPDARAARLLVALNQDRHFVACRITQLSGLPAAMSLG